ncbi:MAG: hypothetical protein IPL99_28230 [Candidatus Competibacteraceae bacterium]|nr:hypothetical protein [Candidatus Competibacteraceae bacterium]
MEGRTRPLMIIADNVSFHRSKEVRDFDRENRQKIPFCKFSRDSKLAYTDKRNFFLPLGEY